MKLGFWKGLVAMLSVWGLYGISQPVIAIEAIAVGRISTTKSVSSMDINQFPNAVAPSEIFNLGKGVELSDKGKKDRKLVPPKVIQAAQQQLQQTQVLAKKMPALAEQAKQLQKHLQTIIEKEQTLDQLIDYFERLKHLTKTGSKGVQDIQIQTQQSLSETPQYRWPH